MTIKRTSSPIIVASERFKPRPKIIQLRLELLNNFGVGSRSYVTGDADHDVVVQNLIRSFDLRVPIVYKKEVNLIGGVEYYHEQFKFDKKTSSELLLFGQNPLKQLSSFLFYKRSLKEKRFVFTYLSSSLNSDKVNFEGLGDKLKSSIALVYGKQVNPNKQMGYGITFGYDLGQPSMFPLFIYNNDFTLNWGLELLLPQQVKLRYSPSNKIHLYAKAGLQGASYHLRTSQIEGFDQLEFRRSSARFSFRVEREIFDWLWIGAVTGYRVPVNVFISEPGKGRQESLIKLGLTSTMYADFSIFMVPPEKIYERAKGN